MDFAGFNWMLMIVIGVVILAVAIAWAMLRNRTSPALERKSEEATRRLYEEEELEHHGEADNVP